MTHDDYIGLRSVVDSYGTACTMPKREPPFIPREVPTNDQAQIARLRESVQRSQDALTEKCGEVAELQRKLADAEQTIQALKYCVRDAALTAERALTRLQEQEALVKTAQFWRVAHPSARDKTLTTEIDLYNEIESKRS